MRGRVGVGIKEWWSRPWLAAGVLLLLCLAVYLPGVVPGLATIPVIDRDEARFAQASRQMLESGDWVIPRVQDRPRLNKPPLIYWLQAGSAWVCTGGDVSRDAIWMYRLPSVLAAIGTVFVTWGLAWRMSGPSVAFLAGSLLAVSPLVAFDAHQARADQVLLFFTTVAMASLWACWQASHREQRPSVGWVLLFWVGIAAGVMTKGPITPLVAGLCIVALSLIGRSWHWVWGLRPALGLALVIAAVMPWVWAVASRFGWGEYLTLVWNETMGRAGGSSEGHLGPPGMHAILLIALLWPGSLCTAQAVRDAISDGWPLRTEAGPKPWWKRVWRRRIGRPRDAFLLAWALPAWVFFELFGAKLAHYPMPLYPAVAILSSRAAVTMTSRGVIPGRLDKGIWLAVGMALAITAILAGANDLMTSPGSTTRGVLAMILGAAAFGLIFLASRRPAWTPDRLLRAGRWSMALALIAVFTSGSAFIPGAESERIMAVVRSVPAWESRPIASTHRQDSMVFHTRGRVARLQAEEIGPWRQANPDGIVVLRNAESQALKPGAAFQTLPVPMGNGLLQERDWVVLVPMLGADNGGRMAGE